MGIVQNQSLSATVDGVNEAFFFGQAIPKAQRDEAARWLVSRQGLSGSYRNMFAPLKADFAAGIKVFTGERMSSGAGTSHILGQETCRALTLLKVRGAKIDSALERARWWIENDLDKACGHYCCGICSTAYWRHLATGAVRGGEMRLAAGMKALKSGRDGAGRWRPYPFYYTLLALIDIDLPAARAELRYAAPVCEKLLTRKTGGDTYDRRRRALLERVLGGR